MGNPVTIFEIAGKKEDNLCDFYSSLFQWDINTDEDCGNTVNTGSDVGINGLRFPIILQKSMFMYVL